jgi:hypothetical protein
MKKKNEIEQELDQKEFENELARDLGHQYDKIGVKEKLTEGKSPIVIGAMNFFVTLIFFEAFYWVIKININFFTLGFTLNFFSMLDPIMHLAFLIVSIHSVFAKKSAADVIIDKWPF